MEPNITPVPPSPTPPKKRIGPVVGIILILFVLILGGLYFWGAELSEEEAVQTADTAGDPNAPDSVTAELEAQSDSDEVDDIERDLNNSNFDDIDQDAAAIEAFY